MATASLLPLPILYCPACSDIHAPQHHSPPKRKSIEVNTDLKTKANELFGNSDNHSGRTNALQTPTPRWVSGAASIVSRLLCFPVLPPLGKTKLLNHVLHKRMSKSTILYQPGESRRGSIIAITTSSIYVPARSILLDKYSV